MTPETYRESAFIHDEGTFMHLLLQYSGLPLDGVVAEAFVLVRWVNPFSRTTELTT